MKISNNFFQIFTAIVIFFSSWIIFYNIPNITYFILILILFIARFEYPYNTRRLLLFIFFLCLSIYVWYPRYGEFQYLHLPMFIQHFSIATLFLLSEESVKKIYKYLLNIFLFILIPGIIFHSLSLFNIFETPLITTKILENDWMRSYYVYPFYVYEFRPDIVTGLRFSSIFDEPGYLGTICAFMLIINKMHLNKWRNIILIIAGILSLSVAFFLIISLYELFLLFQKKMKYYILLSLLLATTYFVFKDTIDSYLLERLKITEDFWISGDSRGGKDGTLEAIRFLKNQDTGTILWGVGNYSIPFDNKIPLSINNSTWSNLFYRLGLIPFSLLIIFILYLTRKSYQTSIFGLLFIISIYQRPQIFTLIFIFLLITATYEIYNENQLGDSNNM